MANNNTNITNIVRYNSLTFSDIKTDLINYIKTSYPEVLGDFSDSSIGTLLIDLNAGVTNNLSINTDRVFNETQLANSQQISSLRNIAKNLGFNIPARRPSVTLLDISVSVPVLGDRPDPSYFPQIPPGFQAIGGGKIFETTETIDFSSPVSNLGDPNRSIIPNLDSNGIVVSYTITKREIVINGSTNIYKRVISTNDVVPFFSITLPDPDVIEIENVILLEGTNFSSNPSVSDFYTANNIYYEVDYLAQQRIFVENLNSSVTSGGTKAAIWMDITKKFIKEYTDNGFCVLTFGSGDSDVNAFKNGFIKEGVTNRAFLDNFLNNTALGEKLKPNYTLFVRYRTGGGSNSNIGANILTQIGNANLRVNGSRQDLNTAVQKSLRAVNPIPAIGGNDGLSIEQIRNLISYNFSSQGRAVTLTDYLLQVYKMPGKFGSPFRANAFKLNNKVVISILGIGADGKLSNTSNTLLKNNITEYLSGYRMMNDFIEIKDGKIINLGFEIDVYVQNISDNQIANSIITVVTNYFDINKYEMDTNIFLAQLQSEINAVNGVINVINIKVFNKVGGTYSNNVISQQILNSSTGEINIINNTIYATEDSMFEIKEPSKDIKILLRKSVS